MNPSLIPHPSSLALCLALLATGTALAQAMNDPTRPPSEHAGAGDVDTGGPVLQSVMISPTQRSAIISGKVVKVGDQYGDATLIQVAENEVVLKSGDVSQVLRLHPGVEKRETAPSTVKPGPRRNSARSGGKAEEGRK